MLVLVVAMLMLGWQRRLRHTGIVVVAVTERMQF